MSALFITWVLICSIFAGLPSIYYLYTRRASLSPWNLRISRDYFPYISILIPCYNEEKTIKLKLRNLLKVKYPKQKIEIILVDDCSNDNTIEEASNFMKSHFPLKMKILSRDKRRGKSEALNFALKYAKGDIIIVSDADCFWDTSILIKALPYLSDQSVGAITGLEVLLNPNDSWITETETLYNNSVHTIRIGESKIHSTILFQGGFSAYKREILEGFDLENDDSGTALNIVQKGFRTLLVPEAVYFTYFPNTFRGKINIKVRRATQLLRSWTKCLKMLIKNQLSLPLKIFLPEMFLYFFHPILFVLLISMTIFLALENTFILLFLLVLFLATLYIKRSRIFFIEFFQNMCFLLIAIFIIVFNRKLPLWNTLDESRRYVSRESLSKVGSISA